MLLAEAMLRSIDWLSVVLETPLSANRRTKDSTDVYYNHQNCQLVPKLMLAFAGDSQRVSFERRG